MAKKKLELDINEQQEFKYEVMSLGTALASDTPLQTFRELASVTNELMYQNNVNKLVWSYMSSVEDASDINYIALQELLIDNKLSLEKATQYLMLLLDEAMPKGTIKSIGKIIQEQAVKAKLIDIANNRKVHTYEAVAEMKDELSVLQNFGEDETDMFDEYKKSLNEVKTWVNLLPDFNIGADYGQMIVVGARPAQGKTALATSIMSHIVSETDTKIGFISLEMPRKDIFGRMVSNKTETVDTYQRERIVDAYKRKRSQFYITDNTGDNINNIELEMSRLANNGFRIIVVDYLQLIHGDAKKPRYEQVGEISRKLKMFALREKVIVIALAQLNRNTQQKDASSTPKISDLRESGSIEQDADKVILLHSEQYGQADGATKWDMKLIVGKNRQLGSNTYDAVFDKQRQRFDITGVAN